jgi:hypothetical protein
MISIVTTNTKKIVIEMLLQLIAVEKYIQSSIIYDRWVLTPRW